MTIKVSMCALALILIASAAQADSQPISDSRFVTKASVGNMFEMQEAKLALTRATDPNLKGFAKQMMTDHGDAEKKLQDAAGKAGIKVAMTLDKPHQAMLDNLGQYNGSDFDSIYKADQVAAHSETVSLLSDYKQNGKNSDLQSWAKKSLPVVKQHQATIDAM